MSRLESRLGRVALTPMTRSQPQYVQTVSSWLSQQRSRDERSSRIERRESAQGPTRLLRARGGVLDVAVVVYIAAGSLESRHARCDTRRGEERANLVDGRARGTRRAWTGWTGRWKRRLKRATTPCSPARASRSELQWSEAGRGGRREKRTRRGWRGRGAHSSRHDCARAPASRPCARDA